MTFWDFDYLTICAGFALIAAVLIAAVLLVRHLHRRSRARLARLRAEWQALGFFSPQPARAVAGERRGRSVAMFYAGIAYGDNEALVTRIRLEVRPPWGSQLTIKPRRDQFGVARWLYRRSSPKTNAIEDHFLVQSHPLDLAARLLAIPRISMIVLSDPKPAIELVANELQLEQPGYFPAPQDAVALFDMLCDLAEVIELRPDPPGAG